MDDDSKDSGSLEDTNKNEVVQDDTPVDPRTLLTKEQVDLFREIFDAIDVDKKGKIPAKMMGYILRFVGFNPTKAVIKKTIRDLDPNKKGTIDFYTFLLPLAERLEEQPETHEDIIAAFKILDEDELDYLTTDQLSEFLTTLGEELEDFEIELLLKMSETKGTGRVYYTDFVEKMFGIFKPKGQKGKR